MRWFWVSYWLLVLYTMVLSLREAMRLWYDDPELGYDLKWTPVVVVCLIWECLEVVWDAFTRGIHKFLDRLPMDVEPESIHDGKKWE